MVIIYPVLQKYGDAHFLRHIRVLRGDILLSTYLIKIIVAHFATQNARLLTLEHSLDINIPGYILEFCTAVSYLLCCFAYLEIVMNLKVL